MQHNSPAVRQYEIVLITLHEMTLTRVVPIWEPFGRMSPIGIMSRRQVQRYALLGCSRTSQELYFLCCHIIDRVHLLSVAENLSDNRRKVVAKAIHELP